MRTHTLTVSLVSSSILFLVAGGVFAASLYGISNNVGANADLASRIKTESSDVDRFHQLKRLADDTAAQRLKLESGILKPDDIAAFASYIEKIGTYTGADTKIASYAPLANNDSLFSTENLAVTVNAKGAWLEVFQSLQMVEQIPYVSGVDNVTFTKGEDSKKDAPWTASISFRVLKYK